jgi:hypothetical protein
LDDFEEFGAVVSVLACELDEFDCFGDDGAPFRCAGDPDGVAAAELEELFVAE